jgi:acyl CoA:acetate/3-ketoacid CoA transferase alpha subunit
VLERPIRGDVALVYADRADALGNLCYRKTAQNFNPMMATAATLTIAEVREILPIGGLDGESIHTPHIYVDLMVQSNGR